MNDNLTTLLDKLKESLDSSNVITDELTRNELATTTFDISNVPSAIVKPENLEQLAIIIRESCAAKIPVYPVSAGKNWGLGSSCPTRPGVVLVSFELMNSILDYSERLSYITVEPGVTFRQVSDFLKSKSSSLFMPVIGGPPEASLIGNLSEKGDGLGPYGERTTHCAGLKIVIPDGQILSSGYGSIRDSKLTAIHKWGLGPSIDGLFMQSNLGIIASATFWLQKKPSSFQGFAFTLPTESNLGDVIEELRNLQQKDILKPFSLGLWSSWKFAATQAQYKTYEKISSSEGKERVLEEISPLLKNVSWIGVGGLYAPSHKIGKEYRRIIKSKIKCYCKHFIIIDSFRAKTVRILSPLLRAIIKIDALSLIDRLYCDSVFLGNPTNVGKNSLYWRKDIKPNDSSDPNKDKCGVHWMCHAVPFTNEDITKADRIARDCIDKYGYEANLAFINASERVMHLCVALMYDREVDGEDDNAMNCHNELFSKLNAEGYSAYRLGLQSMRLNELIKSEEAQFLAKLKSVIDPDNIVAPGRYEP